MTFKSDFAAFLPAVVPDLRASCTSNDGIVPRGMEGDENAALADRLAELAEQAREDAKKEVTAMSRGIIVRVFSLNPLRRRRSPYRMVLATAQQMTTTMMIMMQSMPMMGRARTMKTATMTTLTHYAVSSSGYKRLTCESSKRPWWHSGKLPCVVGKANSLFVVPVTNRLILQASVRPVSSRHHGGPVPDIPALPPGSEG